MWAEVSWGVLCQNLRFKIFDRRRRLHCPHDQNRRENRERDEQEAAFLARRLPVDRFLWRHEKIRVPEVLPLPIIRVEPEPGTCLEL